MFVGVDISVGRPGVVVGISTGSEVAKTVASAVSVPIAVGAGLWVGVFVGKTSPGCLVLETLHAIDGKLTTSDNNTRRSISSIRGIFNQVYRKFQLQC